NHTVKPGRAARGTGSPVVLSRPMRLAWFSPLPPHRSGIAAYSADVLPVLARTHDIDAYIDDTAGPSAVRAARPLPGVRVRGAFDFTWAHAQHPYDLVVYQLGNDSCHDYMWPYMLQDPGLAVLHDAQLHQARARTLLQQGREEDYVKEFLYNHAEVGEGVPRMVAVGVGSAFYYLWPMLRIPLEGARLVAVHNRWLAGHLEAEFSTVQTARIRMGVPDPLSQVTTSSDEIRRRLRIPDDGIIFAAFGRVTPEKCLTAVIMALAQLGTAADRTYLVCVGETVTYYDLIAEARQVGLGDRIRVTGYVGDDDLPSYLAAADACVCLRWPTARETSASWLRCVAAGKPTVVHELLHTSDVPTLDVRTMAVRSTGPGKTPAPIAVGIDMLDEASMLRQALGLLIARADLRQSIGAAARTFWSADATIGVMAEDYERALMLALSLPGPANRAAWPRHLSVDGTEKTRSLVGRQDQPAVVRALDEALGPATDDRTPAEDRP
ncbi:MAG: glycosyltransferase family 4 protein, partial [Vicinamibacterales bacterium]|nr:glycosyltransferase family 4 protein [Vicinamibacterales bacterium]